MASRIRDPWWHVLGLCFGLVFALMLTVARLYPLYFDAIDQVVEEWFVPYQTFGSVEFFLTITVLGSGIGVAILSVLAAYFLRSNRFAVLQLILVMTFASVSMGIAKTFVERARPESLLWLDPMNTYSFPSGHATLATAFFGFITVCLYRRIKSSALRFLACSACVLIIVLVCLSRLVLSYHYFTDIIAGVLLGLFWIALVYMLPSPKT